MGARAPRKRTAKTVGCDTFGIGIRRLVFQLHPRKAMGCDAAIGKRPACFCFIFFFRPSLFFLLYYFWAWGAFSPIDGEEDRRFGSTPEKQTITELESPRIRTVRCPFGMIRGRQDRHGHSGARSCLRTATATGMTPAAWSKDGRRDGSGRGRRSCFCCVMGTTPARHGDSKD